MKKKFLFLIGSLSLFPNVVSAAALHPDFTDDNLYMCVVDSYNQENSSMLSYSTQLTDQQLSTITALQCNHIDSADEDKVIATKGIEKLINLEEICLIDNKVASIDLSHNSKLRFVRMDGNMLTNVNFGNINNVVYLTLSNNRLKEIDSSNFSSLAYLNLNNNNLKEIDVRQNPKLQLLHIENNNITHLDISENSSLHSLTVDDSVKVHLTKVSSNLGIKGNHIIGISPNSTVADLRRNILSNNENYEHRLIEVNVMTIMDELDPNTPIKTGYGYQVQYSEKYKRSLLETYTLVVMGDVTGTGEVSIADVARLYQYYKKKVPMNEEYIIAGDVTNDGQIEVNDISKLYQYAKHKIDSLE